MALQELLLDGRITPGESPETANSYTIKELSDHYMEAHPDIAGKMSPFDKIQEKYSSQERGYIKRAVIIATIAHQYNWNVEKRQRKKVDPQTGKPIPYIYHSLEMAERLVDD